MYGFDEYIEEDDFEADKYTELQTLTREVALRIYEVLISMKLEAVSSKEGSSHSFLNQFSPPTSPMPPPNFPVPPTPPRSSIQSALGPPSSPHPGTPKRAFQSVYYANEELESFRDRQPSTGSAPEDGNAVTGPSQPVPPPLQIPPPRPPSANPWDTTVIRSSDESGIPTGGEGIPRRPFVAPPSPRPPPYATTSPISPSQQRGSPVMQRRPIGSSSGQQPVNPEAYPYDEAEWKRLTNQQYGLQSTSPHTSSPLHLNKKLPPFPEEDSQHDTGNSSQPTRQASTSHHAHQISLESTSVPQERQRDMFSDAPQRRSRSDSIAESILDPYLNNVRISDHWRESAGGFDRAPIAPAYDVDDGLIPVEADDQPPAPLTQSQQNCSIGSNSSFFTNKGFCSGAEEVVVGGLGVKKMRKPVVGVRHVRASKSTWTNTFAGTYRNGDSCKVHKLCFRTCLS